MDLQAQFRGLLKLMVPEVIVTHFDLKEIIEKPSSITLMFEEKPDRIPKALEGEDVSLDGYMNKVELQTFPLKDKTVYLAIRRRRWKKKGEKQSYSNSYDLHIEGMKTTKEFGDFLKEELGLQPDEYNKLWESLTN